MTENSKTADEAVTAFLNGIEPKTRSSDAQVLLTNFREWTGWSARLWGPSIVGFGSYHYRYESGREGDCHVTGFSPRKASLSIYIMPGYRDISDKLQVLGKHKMGQACLYINKLSDIDMNVLEEIVKDGVTFMKANYEVTPS
jgi:hypothetical protein